MIPYEYTLEHDQDGRIIEKIETVNGQSVVWKYTYDTASRLSTAHLDDRLICQCWYDKEGRRQQDHFPATAGWRYRNYRYNLDNRLMAAGNNGYTHDRRGFRSIWDYRGRYVLYEYAPDYRLLKMEVENEDCVYQFTHTENGQREAKYFNGQLVEAYQWLDFVRLAWFQDGQNEYEFGYEDGARMPFAMRRDDGAVASLFYDQVGSLRVVADQSGNVIKEVLYDPFGEIMEDTNPGLRIPLGFAGGLHDRDLDFVRFGWRDYDTKTGRWTAPDPIGDAGGDDDWYGYCLDDPVNAVDPLGLLRNEYGEEVRDGRIITDYMPGIDMLFSGFGTSKRIKKGLKETQNDYQDNNDWKMRKELQNEAESYNLWKGIWDTATTDTDDQILNKRINNAKERIAK